jgi:hypothetical protein
MRARVIEHPCDHGRRFDRDEDLPLTANAIPEAVAPGSVIQRYEHLVTFDTDFKKLLRSTQLTVLKSA